MFSCANKRQAAIFSKEIKLYYKAQETYLAMPSALSAFRGYLFTWL